MMRKGTLKAIGKLAVTTSFIAALIIQPVAGAQATSLPPSVMRNLIERTLPPDAVTGSLGAGSSAPEEGPEQPLRPSQFFEEALGDDPRTLGNPRTLARAQDAFLENLAGHEVPDLGSILSEQLAGGSASAAESGSDQSIEEVQVGYPAGDLDGDQLDDVLELWARWNSDTYELLNVELRGRSGKTATQLWARDLTGVYDLFLLKNGDLNNDGSDDLVLLELLLDSRSFTGICSFPICASDLQYGFQWRLTPISGLSGQPLWSKTFSGTVDVSALYASPVVAGAYANKFKVTNALVGAWVTGSEVIVDLFDYEGVFSYQYALGLLTFAYALEEVSNTSTTAYVFVGSSGNERYMRKSENHEGESYLFPVGQTVGSPAQDLAWYSEQSLETVYACAYAYLTFKCAQAPRRVTATLDMIDGELLQTSWVSSFDDPSQESIWISIAHGDLDGDGAQDLLVYQFFADNRRLTALSGATGETLWSDNPSTLRFYPIGSVGGHPGTDLLTIGYELTDDGFSLELIRLDGATSEELFRTSFSPSYDDYEYIDYWAYLFGDADGDGIEDLLVGEYSYSEGSGRIRYILESGRTGGVLATRTGPSAYLFRGGDLNGDGTIDGIASDGRRTGSTYELDFSGVALPVNTTMWTRTETFGIDREWSIWLNPSRDMSGAGGDDLLMNQRQYVGQDWDLQSRFAPIEGHTGATGWVIGDQFDSPTIHAGSISGSVTSTTGEALQDICVSISGVTHSLWLSARTGLDGTYLGAALPDGMYRVRFDGCGSGDYETQWYDGANNIDDADIVEVTDGASVTGIDAQLVEVPDPPDYSLLREETHAYVGLMGDLYTTGPFPERFIGQGCSHDSMGIGGTCFDLRSTDKAIEVTIDDSSGKTISGYYSIRAASSATLSSGWFCGSSSRITVPQGSKEVFVYTESAYSVLTNCASAEIATSGSITASFYGIEP